MDPVFQVQRLMTLLVRFVEALDDSQDLGSLGSPDLYDTVQDAREVIAEYEA